MTDHVFLTGATGFLGSEIARALRRRGAVVHATVRASSNRAALEGLELRWREAELEDAPALLRALADSRAEAGAAALDVVHCGAHVSYRTRDAERARRANVDGTRNVLAAAERHGARRFLYVSSIVTLGPSADGSALDERARGDGERLRVDYVTTKRAAEELALAARDRLDVVVVNPVAIFGSASGASNSAEFLRRVRRGRIPFAPPGGMGAVGVEDAAEGCVLALERGRRGERYVLCASNLDYLELLRLAASIGDVPPPFGRIPRVLWAASERALRLVDRLRPLERLTPQSMRMLGARFPGDSTRARAELGWSPRPIGEVLAKGLHDGAEARRASAT